MKILFVCLGNICRSPIAEGVMKHFVGEAFLDWEIDSAATNSYHIGEPPHKHSQQVCLEHGIDISGQRARRFSHTDFDKYDKIYAMATDVLDEIKDLSGHYFNDRKVQLFLNEMYPGENKSVTDPWYGTLEGYYPVFDQIQDCCKIILDRYKTSS
jgi:protein-tyrosine phosphatase